MNAYQLKQIEVVNEIEKQIQNNSIDFSTVSPVNDYEKDPRICLTSVHIPYSSLISKIQKEIIDPLCNISPQHFYYPSSSFHTTIKNIRIINNPPHFTKEDIKNAQKVFEEIIPKYQKFNIYFYRLLLFPNNLALVGTTDEELNNIISDLDKRLKEVGVADDKKYSNEKYFFSHITLARFLSPLTDEFKQEVTKLSHSLSFEPYTVDSVILLTANAVFKKRSILGSWKLQ